GRRLRLTTVIGNNHWRLFLDRQSPIIFDSYPDRPRELGAPIFVRDQFTLATLRQKSPFDQHRWDFGQAQHRESGALDTAIELGDMPEKRMINASRKCQTLPIYRTARLHVGKTGSHD